MNLVTIAWKSLQQRALSTTLTALSVALGVMLMVAVLVIYGVLQTAFSQNSINYDLIVGSKGSPLQLVLSTIYRVGAPIENLPYRYYEELKADGRIALAIPVALGDTTEAGSFPIMGTTPDYFLTDYAPGRQFRLKGDMLRNPFDAVIGQRVAKENGWGLGSKFKLVHGGAETGHVHNEEFTVIGILATTGSPNDKTVFVHLDGFYAIEGHDAPLDQAIRRERDFFGQPPLSAEEMAAEVARLNKQYGHDHHDHAGHDHSGHDHSGHDHSGHDHSGHDHAAHATEIAPVQKEVTAILVQTKTQTAAVMMSGELKKGYKAQAVNPIGPMNQLMTDVLGNIKIGLLVLTGLIIVVSGIGIFVSIYNSMSARRREIGIYRALGASRQTVLSLVLLESALLCVGGGVFGLLAGHALVFVAAPFVEASSGLIINPLSFEIAELYLIPALLLLGTIVGFIPAMTAYRTDVADALQN